MGGIIPGLQSLHPSTDVPPKSIFNIFRRRAADLTAEILNTDPLHGKEREEALAVLGASFVLCGVLLGLVLVLQVGEWYVTESTLKAELQEREALRATKIE